MFVKLTTKGDFVVYREEEVQDLNFRESFTSMIQSVKR